MERLFIELRWKGLFEMQRSRRLLLGRAGRALALLGLVITTSLVAFGSPAQAGVTMTLRQRITVPGLIRHEIIAAVIMSQADAQSEIARGARIEVECWGADTIADDFLPDCPKPGFSGTVTYSRVDPELIANANGVHLDIVNLYEKGTVLNEDLFDDDEIYVKARWIDAEGHTITLKTAEISGSF
jgi:hypothetical protein